MTENTSTPLSEVDQLIADTKTLMARWTEIMTRHTTKDIKGFTMFMGYVDNPESKDFVTAELGRVGRADFIKRILMTGLANLERDLDSMKKYN